MSAHQTVPTERNRSIEATKPTRRQRRVCKESEDMEKLERPRRRAFRGDRPVVRIVAFAMAAVWAMASPALAQFTSGSSGVHGAFPPTPQGEAIPSWSFLIWNVKTGGVRYCGTYTLGSGLDVCDPGSNPNVFAQIIGIPQGGLTTGIYEFTDFEVTTTSAAHRQIIPVGVDPNTPLIILSQSDIEFLTGGGTTLVVRLNGSNGQNALGSAQNLAVIGGRGGPGGFNGGSSGNGGATPGDGNPGFGSTGGNGGDAQAAAAAGLQGSAAQASSVNPSLTPLVGGSGGGGGAGATAGQTGCSANNASGYGGGGGGGGGGAILLAASGRVVLASNVTLSAGGGNAGYNPQAGCGLSGGGGAGGSVRIVANEFTGIGTIDLNGGTDAFTSNRAPGGQLRVEANFNTFTGPVNGSSGNSSDSELPDGCDSSQSTNAAHHRNRRRVRTNHSIGHTRCARHHIPCCG